MRNLFLLLFVVMISCKEKQEKPEIDLKAIEIEKNGKTLETIGKTYYENNCYACHSSKFAIGNFLAEHIRGDFYDYDFFKDYVINQDSLLKNNNELALEFREMFQQSYLHKFDFNDNELKAIYYYLRQ